MLRISIINEDSRTVINLEGKLTGEWVKELEQSWNKAKLEHEGKPVEVVLRAVSYEDEAGKKLLADLAAQGAELKGCGCMTGALIQEIVSGVKTKLAALSGKKSLALIAMLLTLGACQSLRAQEPASLKVTLSDAVALALRYQRADLGLRIEWIAHLQGAGEISYRIDNFVVPTTRSQHPGIEPADLAIVQQGAPE